MLMSNPVASIKLQTPAELIAISALAAQSAAVQSLIARIDEKFNATVQVILASKGRLVVSGMGKSGLVGQKIAATLASTGTPSFFLHPGEALHGDLGMIVPGDIVLLISNSGETDEVLRLLPALAYFGNTLIAMTGISDSPLAKAANHVLDIAVEREICPLNLAPTTSTLVTMAMGDALAVALMDARGFEPQDFARFHPGGRLGKRLLTRVIDVMRRDLPLIHPTATLREAMLAMTAGRLGLAIVAQAGQLKGILTDGDLRRSFSEKNAQLDDPVTHFMSPNPMTIGSQSMWFEAESLMLERKIKSLVVVDDASIVGVVDIFDR